MHVYIYLNILIHICTYIYIYILVYVFTYRAHKSNSGGPRVRTPIFLRNAGQLCMPHQHTHTDYESPPTVRKTKSEWFVGNLLLAHTFNTCMQRYALTILGGGRRPTAGYSMLHNVACIRCKKLRYACKINVLSAEHLDSCSWVTRIGF